jgi:hypothetical protein
MMKEQDKIAGLNKRHVAQIIRRNMVQRVKDSKKVYDRKKRKKKFGILRKGSYIHGIEINKSYGNIFINNSNIVFRFN